MITENEIRINKLTRQLELAEDCIFAIIDALDRGGDNSWAREAIDNWERANEVLEEYHV
jgi:hypothetical protein